MKRLVYYLVLQLIFFTSVFAQEETLSLSSEEDSASIISLTSKPVVKDNKIVLQWKCRRFENNGFCIIERSADEKNFEVIGVIKMPALQTSFEFMDEKPMMEKNYYRIKVNGAEGKIFFSQTLLAESRSGVSCKFYPNPVDKLLIVKTDYAGELQITDALSKARINQQLQPGLQIVDVSALDKGLYILTILRNNTNIVISEKMVKN